MTMLFSVPDRGGFNSFYFAGCGKVGGLNSMFLTCIPAIDGAKRP